MSLGRTTVYLLTMAFLYCALPLLALAQSPAAITDISGPIDKNLRYDTTSVQPGTIMEYPLTADMFSWSVSSGSPGETVTLAQLRQSNITVKHSIAQSQVIKDVTIATTTYNGQTTACVKVEFAEEFASVNKREFKLTIYLSMGNSRKDASAITLFGDFENEEVTIDLGDEYISLADGKVLIVNDYISNLEIDMGNGVQLFTKVLSGRKYYATAQNKILNADDAMLKKHPEIDAVIRLKTINLTPAGKCVSLRDVGNYNVYNASGTYLGTTDELVAFSDIYYLSGEKFNMSGGASKPGSSGDSGDEKASPKQPFGDTPEEKAAKSDMADAAKDAAKSGSNTANMKVKDVESVSASELQAMFESASSKGLKSKYTADTTTPSGQSIEGRIIINPALAVKLPGDIQLGVYVNKDKTSATFNQFKKYYENKIAVVSLAQKGSYWMPVSIAAKVNLDGMNTKNLYFYSYDKAANSVSRIVNPRYYIDSSGYLHFTTILASEIIISDGVLSKT